MVHRFVCQYTNLIHGRRYVSLKKIYTPLSKELVTFTEISCSFWTKHSFVIIALSVRSSVVCSCISIYSVFFLSFLLVTFKTKERMDKDDQVFVGLVTDTQEYVTISVKLFRYFCTLQEVICTACKIFTIHCQCFLS